jgi:hypothetical protein
MPPVSAEVVGEAGRAGLSRGEAGDRVHGHGPPAPAGKRSDPAGDSQGLDGVGEAQAGDGGDLEGAHLDAAVALVAGAVQDRDIAPWQRGQLRVQRRLVALTRNK